MSNIIMAFIVFVLVFFFVLIASEAFAKRSAMHCRDAISGRYVTPAYAKAHPMQTVCERTRRK